MGEDTVAGTPRILMVDDEKEVADAYALRLDGVADVTTAYGAREALEAVAEETVPDVILLDRHMPGRSGDDLLSEFRDRDLHTRIIMVTAVDPGLDILELPFDDYLCKPVERQDLRTAVDQQCQVLAYQLLGEYFELAAKRALLRAELPQERLDDHPEVANIADGIERITDRIRRLRPAMTDMLGEFTSIERETI